MCSKTYDVAIVGCGPAGATVARKTAEHGLSTIIIERRKKVGIPVQCGEILPTPHEMKRLFTRSPRASKLVDIPKELILNSCQHLSLLSPRKRMYSFPFEFNVIQRDMFDKMLAQQAIDAGAIVQLQSRVIGLDSKGSIYYRRDGNIEKIQAKIIIGADGPSSIVSKYLGSQYSLPDRDMSYSLHYVVEGINLKKDTIELNFGKNIGPGGYLWVIPRNETSANIGLGIRKRYRPIQSLRSILNLYIRQNPSLSEGTVVSSIAALIPVGGPKNPAYTDSMLIVGDAAGHVMCTNGGGIPPALVGGSIAGEVVCEHFNNGCHLSEYQKRWNLEMGRELYSSETMLRVVDFVMKKDALVEVGMRIMGSRFLESVIRCRYPLFIEPIARLVEPILTRL